MRTRLRALLYLALVFLCGLVAGALAIKMGEPHWVYRGAHNHPDWKEARSHILEQVTQELVLTPDQSRQIETILDETVREFEELHSRAHGVRLQAKERIRSILTDQQKRKFEDSMVRLQRRYGVSE